MAGKIFINYRRSDDPGFTQALYQRLEDAFAADNLFMDVEGSIKPGDDFVAVLNAQVTEADVLIAVIGPRWSELLAARANAPDDFVTIEIKAALENNKRVIPVLVGGASIPRADSLPEVIRPLARRNAVGLRPERFKADCQGLIAALKEQLAAAATERAAARLEGEVQVLAQAQAAEERHRAQSAEELPVEEIRKEDELANWEFVEDRNDIQDLRDHLARFPGGTTERYALAKLDQLVWAALGSTPDIAQLQGYLDEFPKGANALQAQTRIDALEKEAEEERAAEQRRAQETAEWGTVAASTDRGAIEAFLRQWPLGQYARAARARIEELRRGSGGIWRSLLLGTATGGLVAIISVGVWFGYHQPPPTDQTPTSQVAADTKADPSALAKADRETAPAAPRGPRQPLKLPDLSTQSPRQLGATPVPIWQLPSAASSTPAPNLTGPITPNLVKTIPVKGASGRTASLDATPLQAGASQPADTPAPHIVTTKLAPEPPPPPATQTLASLDQDFAPVTSGTGEPLSLSPPQADTGWVIQVGGFEDELAAKALLDLARSKAPEVLGHAQPYTETVIRGDKTIYRARFAGFDQDQAKVACEALKRSDVPCMASSNAAAFPTGSSVTTAPQAAPTVHQTKQAPPVLGKPTNETAKSSSGGVMICDKQGCRQAPAGCKPHAVGWAGPTVTCE